MSLGKDGITIGPAFTSAASPDVPKRRLPPFSLRLSGEDRARLEHDAAGLSLAAYIRWRLFDPDSAPPRGRGRAPIKDQQALAGLLGQLGKSRLSNNLNQLARAVNSGSLPVSPDVEDELRQAAAEIMAMRVLLIDALGLKPEDSL